MASTEGFGCGVLILEITFSSKATGHRISGKAPPYACVCARESVSLVCVQRRLFNIRLETAIAL